MHIFLLSDFDLLHHAEFPLVRRPQIKPIYFRIFWLSTKCRPTINRVLTSYWPIHRWSIDELSAKCRRKVGEVLVKYRWTKSYIGRDTSWTTIDRVSTECRPTIVRVSTDYRPLYRPTIDRLSTDYRPSVDRLSTAISTDRSVDTTYNKHDPISFYYDSPNNQLAKSTSSCFSVWRAIQITKLSETFKSKQFSSRFFFRDMLSSVVMRARRNEFESERGQKLTMLLAYSTVIWTQGPFL